MMKEKQRSRTAQDQKGHIASPTPRPEAKPQHEASSLKPQGQLDTDRCRSSNAKVHVCTYSARTLRTDGDTSRLVKELGNTKWHVVGFCETKRRGEWLRELSGRGWGGRKGGGGHGCMKQDKQRKTQMQTGWHLKSIQTELSHVQLNYREKTLLQIMQTYAPTSDLNDKTVEMF